MEELIAMIMVVDWIADDIHYNSRGPEFYGLHIMADKCRDFGSAVDDLKEKYWLGFLDTTPPSGKEFAQKAIAMYAKYENDGYLDAMHNSSMDIVHMVKSLSDGSELPNGVLAILDEISSHALTCSFFASASNGRAQD